MTATAKLGTPLTVIGALTVVGTILFSFMGLRDLQAQIDDRQQELDDLDTQIQALNAEINLLKNGPLTDLVEVDALGVRIDGKRDQKDRQLYDFSLWIDVPNNRKGDIEKVAYRRIAGERLQDVLSGSEPSNGFRVSYLGWGCFYNVDVTIFEVSGEESTIRINQCQLLRDGGMVWYD